MMRQEREVETTVVEKALNVKMKILYLIFQSMGSHQSRIPQQLSNVIKVVIDF